MKPGTILLPNGQAVSPAPARRSYYGNGYQSAGFSKSRTLLPGMITDAWRELDPRTRRELMRKARFMKKNSGLSRAMAITIRDYAVGPGIFPIPSTEDDDWNELAMEWWSEHAKVADVSGKHTVWSWQSQMAWCGFWDGELFTLLTEAAGGMAQFQIIRAHQVGDDGLGAEEGWRDGIRINDVGRPRAFRVKQRDEKYKAVPAGSMLHFMLQEDPEALRGVTAMMFALNTEHDVHDLLALEKEAVKDNSRIARVIYNESGEVEDSDAAHFAAPDASTPSDLAREAVYGAEVPHLGANERMENWVSNRPSPAFTGFLDYLGRLLTQGAGMPYEFAWAPQKINAAGQRSLLDRVDRCCDFWARGIARPTSRYYTYALGRAIDAGELPAIKGWWRHEVVRGAPRVSIDKAKDAREDRENLKMGLDTIKAYYARHGRYWKTELRQTAKEQRFILDLAEEFNLDVARIQQLTPNDAGQGGGATGREEEDEDKTPTEDQDEE